MINRKRSATRERSWLPLAATGAIATITLALAACNPSGSVGMTADSAEDSAPVRSMPSTLSPAETARGTLGLAGAESDPNILPSEFFQFSNVTIDEEGNVLPGAVQGGNVDTDPRRRMATSRPDAADNLTPEQQEQIKNAILRVREFQLQEEYRKALDVIDDEILAIDPDNKSGILLRELISETVLFYETQEFVRQKNLNIRMLGLNNDSDGAGDSSLLPGASADRTLIPNADNTTFRAPSMTIERIPGGATMSATDELWVITKPAADAPPPPGDVPRSGALLATIDDEEVPAPLEHTEVLANIDGYISSVEMTQTFSNPFDTKIEAVYVFPLPQNAAVNDFLMTVGDRTIRGVIREREEAEAIYYQARASGHRASLLNQERANIFTQRVANIEPGEAIDIEITYFHTLAYHDGWYTWSLPMVVGPRFNPPARSLAEEGAQGNGIGAVGRNAQGASNQQTEVTYLASNERTSHDIDVVVDLAAGVEIEKLESPSHVIVAAQEGSNALVKLAPLDRIPNRDFVLRWKVAGDDIKGAIVAQPASDDADDDRGYFTMMLTPPAELESLERAPVELVFVVDTSGSMDGEPISQVKQAMRRALQRLEPGDSFQIIDFSNTARKLASAPLEANSANVSKGLRYVERLEAGGGTMLDRGLIASLKAPRDPQRTRYIAFMTDGFIGNDREVVGILQRELPDYARVFSFGVGSSPNRFLMQRMASLGRGVVAYLNPGDSATDIMDAFFDRVSKPALADINIDWGGLEVSDVYPKVVTDMYVGRPLIITGRYNASSMSADTRVTLEGRAGKSDLLRVSLAMPDANAPEAAGALPSVWARAKIADLADLEDAEQRSMKPEILAVALPHNLMSAHSSFVAVDTLEVTEGESGVTVPVTVPVPQGVRYDTTVSNESPRQSPDSRPGG